MIAWINKNLSSYEMALLDSTMLLQKQPNEWSCLATAFAIAFNIPLESMLNIIGHDGSEDIHPHLSIPYCKRSFHIQEMIDVGFELNYAIVQIDLELIQVAGKYKWSAGIKAERFATYMAKYVGVLTGIAPSGKPHAVAWNGHLCLDPNGTQYKLDKFDVDTFFLIIKINITDETIFEKTSE